MSIVMIGAVRTVAELPVVTARGDAHKFGNKKRNLPPPKPAQKSSQRVKTTLRPSGKANLKRPIKSTKPAVKLNVGLVKTKSKVKTGSKKWWNSLTRQEQKLYIKSHPKTKRQITAKRGLRRSANQAVNPDAKPVAPTTPPRKHKIVNPDNKHVKDVSPAAPVEEAAPEQRHKLSLKDIVKRAEKTLSSRDFAWMFSSSKSRYRNIGKEMQEVAQEPKKGDKDYKEKLAAWQAQQAKLNTPQANVPQNVKSTAERAAVIGKKAEESNNKLPEPKDAQQATQQLFGHLVDQSDNKIINHVSKHISGKDKELLGQAMAFADKHPDDAHPPHKFAKALGRVLLFAVTAGAGAALLGPAGVILAVNGFDQFKNKTGESLPKFAWRALKGGSLKPEEIDREKQEKEAPEFDKTEQPIARIIKNLKKQLAQTEDEKGREPIKNLIEELGDKMEDYNTYEKDDNSSAPTGRRRRH